MRHLTSYLTIPSHSSLSLVPFLNISWEKGRKSNCHPVMGGQLNLPKDVRASAKKWTYTRNRTVLHRDAVRDGSGGEIS